MMCKHSAAPCAVEPVRPMAAICHESHYRQGVWQGNGSNHAPSTATTGSGLAFTVVIGERQDAGAKPPVPILLDLQAVAQVGLYWLAPNTPPPLPG